ncbi:hypothetical protein BYT27DRAFT_7206005 [Phlegmacium glaucopus]|nr:hypothetical protein BYT27DRAFT_7206005 [Phlegmacium glaucopus]
MLVIPSLVLVVSFFAQVTVLAVPVPFSNGLSIHAPAPSMEDEASPMLFARTRLPIKIKKSARPQSLVNLNKPDKSKVNAVRPPAAHPQVYPPTGEHLRVDIPKKGDVPKNPDTPYGPPVHLGTPAEHFAQFPADRTWSPPSAPVPEFSPPVPHSHPSLSV